MHGSRRQKIDELAEEIAATAASIDAARHALLTTIRTFDDLKGWAAQGATSCAAWLSWRIGIGLGAAREQVRVARRLAELPRLDEALKKGEISYTKVRAMTRVATPANEELLMHQARGSTGAQLERICAAFARLPDGARPTDPERRYVRKRTHRDGTMTLEMRLLPDEVDELWGALRETQKQLAPSQEERPSMADAALHWARLEAQAMACAAGGEAAVDGEPERGASPKDQPPEPESAALDGPPSHAPSTTHHLGLAAAPRAMQPLLFVHLRPEHLDARLPSVPANDIDHLERWRAELHDGTLISGDSLKRIACDCGLVTALVDGRGTPLELGRRRRTVSVPLMRALRLRDRGCRFPGCKRRAYTQAHHIQHWCDGGETNEDNLVLLCQQHHVAVHEGGCDVELRREESGPTFIFRDPDGRLIPDDPGRPALSEEGLASLRKRQRARGIDAIRPVPLWDGTPLDLEAAVGALAWKTQLHADAEAAFPTTNYLPQEVEPSG